MRGLFLLALAVGVSTSYGPPRNPNNGCGGGGGGCGGGQPLPAQTVSCGGNGCGNSGGSSAGGSGDYWWAGNDSPFSGPSPTHVVVSSSSSSSGVSGGSRPVAPSQQRPRPQQGYIQPSQFPGQASLPQQPSVTQNLVQPPMGICPASYVCVHWQLCRDGFVISDGTGNINKRIRNIPANVASRYESCGGDMICCGIPAGTLPSSFPRPQPQRPGVVSPPLIAAPAPLPPRQPPASQQPFRPAPAPAPAPAPQFVKPIPAPQPPKPSPNPQLTLPAPAFKPAPAPQPARPAPQPARPAPQPSIPAPQNPTPGYGRPPVPQNPLTPQRPNQQTPQSTFLNPNNPAAPQPPRQPSVPISNPIGLVSPANPPPNPMMGGMMMGMMGMPARGGSCSAGTYCVQPNQCNPYTGFIIRDASQLMAVWPDAPTVPLLPCFIPDGSITNGVCCQEVHPNAGGFD
ncbi:uncharacterized protein [Palaemon carinicauda]|uniref:uncharacterized protein n=1 Tax=Palaemon carinicauda TaxID=392227 RepID=UPI0035B69235